MPWNIKEKPMLRKEFVSYALQEGSNISQLCRYFGISRRVGYKWLDRYQELGEAGLEDQSRKPVSSPNKMAGHIESFVLAIRDEHPCWGGRKIQKILEKEGQLKEVPSPSCITDILRRNGRISKEASTAKERWHRFEHEAPNRLWQMDFKGHFAMEHGRCHPLTVLDDHSRFSLGLKACSNEQESTVKSHLVDIFRQYGLPDRMNLDNGSPWGSSHANGTCYTRFAFWLIDQGVRVSYSSPHHPQTNGKDERFHRTLKEEVLQYHYLRGIAHAQEVFDRWRHCYNAKRPHDALGLETPLSRYRPSHREYSEKVKPYEYDGNLLVKRVDTRGAVYVNGIDSYVTESLAGKYLGIKITEDKLMEIFYRQQKIKVIDLSAYGR